MLDKGYVQIYTGNGKGKTTAALGLSLRAAGAGLKTAIIQFMKGQHYSELESVKMLKGLVTIEQYGSKKFCRPETEDYQEHYDLTRKGLERAKEVIADESLSIVILDEIITCLIFKLITADEIIQLIDLKPERMELVLTGRGVTDKLINRCDLVTEMCEVKHYYNDGVMARKGVEN